MKLGKKLWSILLTMVMVLAMAVPAVAANETTTDIVITNGATGSVYSAWRVLEAKESEDGKFEYSVNETYLTDLIAVINDSNVNNSSKIITYISKLSGDATQDFADDLFARLKTKTADAKSVNSEFDNMPQGYYLIAETTKGADPDTVSKVMLDTKGKTEVKVETKEGTVELEKKVGEEVGTDGAINLQDGADYDFGDAVPFQLKGTLPANYNGYDTYYYCFVDDLSSGLSFNSGSVEVYVADADVTDIMAEGVAKTPINKSAFTLTETSTGFKLEFDDLKADLKAIDVTLTADDAIFVRYTATLTSGATIGAAGNPNEAKVEFSNDPYSNRHGETVKDVVIVFTYEYDVNKVDGAGEALTGAGFTLYKKVGSEWVAVGNEIVGGDITTFEFKGLDSGDYKLVETTVPTGYNKADDIEFKITAFYGAAGNPPQFSHLTINGTEYTTGIVVTEVENLTGTELPSTGGIGTTIFYVAGGILVVGAAVMLIAKKRTENEE